MESLQQQVPSYLPYKLHHISWNHASGRERGNYLKWSAAQAEEEEEEDVQRVVGWKKMRSIWIFFPHRKPTRGKE